MFITPINGISPTSDFFSVSKTEQAKQADASFKDIFRDLIDNVNATDAVAKQDAYLIASGQADDLHTILINAEKAELALQTLVQMRNKVLDAYNEIMRITV